MRVALAGSVIFACLGLCLIATVSADGHGRGDERVEELMERTHEGRRSPYGQLKRMMGGEQADWAAVERAVAGFEPMCRALAESKVDDIRGSADGYLDAVKELRQAVGRRDEAGARKAFTGLTESCGDCHFKGGVGGPLERDE